MTTVLYRSSLEPLDVAGEPIYNPLYLYNIVNNDATNDITLRDNFSIIWRFLQSFQLRGRIGMAVS